METFIIAAIIGVIIGIFSGLLGIGGGTLMVPIFRLGFGMSAISSTATSLFTIIPTSLAGLITHVKNKTCIPKVGVLCGLGGACTSPLGVYLASISPSWAIMFAAAAIIGYSSYSMFRKAIRMPKIAPQGESAVTGKDLEKEAEKAARAAQTAQAQAAQAAQAAAVQGEGQTGTTKAAANATKTASAPKKEPFKLSIKKVALCLLIGLIAGLASGYVGVGGGFIMVPLFISLLGIMMRQASGTSLVAVTILAIPGVVEQGLLGHIDYIAGIAMAVGSIPGAVIGASLIRKVPERKLRFVFGAFLLISAVVLLFNELLPLFV
ncbi:MAG: sulfite exporter TauE/SafE family protein [Eggerthellaceae bacterium]|nr:sulfite exporter TauE/SafE family protein [Eggerthellaceae bacterium]